MKKVNMTLRNKFTVVMSIFGAIVLALFAGCSELNDGSKNTSSSIKSCTVSGKVSVGSAIPSELTNVVSADVRSATSLLSTDGMTFSVYAYKGWGADLDVTKNADGTFDSSTMSYTIGLPGTGNWTIYVHGSKTEKGSGIEGLAEVTVKEDYSAIAQAIILKPQYSVNENDYGTVSLTLKDSSRKIKSVSYYAPKMMLVGNENSFAENETIDFVDGVATISRDDVKAGNYTIEFTFDDENGNTLYKCQEIVSVFAGFTTDTWVGTGSHLVENDGVVEFVVADELISLYGAETIPTTKMVLYNTTTSATSSSTSAYLADSATGTMPETADFSGYFASSFAFDSEGNVYYLDVTESTPKYLTIKSNKADFNTITTTIGAYEPKVFIDRAEDTLWIYAYNSTMNFYGYKNISDGTRESGAPDVSYALTSFYADPEGNKSLLSYGMSFAANDGILYASGKVYYLGKYYIYFTYGNFAECVKSSGTSFYGEKAIALNLSGKISDDGGSISDMLYQDGYVYILARDVYNNVSEVSPDSYAFYSRGALVRVNTWNNKVSEPLGLLSEPRDNTSSKFYAYMDSKHVLTTNTPMDDGTGTPLWDQIAANSSNWLTIAGNNSNYSSYYLENSSDPKTIAETLPKLYSPTEGSDSEYFYGPQKFIAINPKKLVIADDGHAFYIDSNEAWAARNKNRVVEVDLEKFAITAAAGTSATFSYTGSGDSISSDFTSIESLGLSSCVYLSNGSEFSATSDTTVSVGYPFAD